MYHKVRICQAEIHNCCFVFVKKVDGRKKKAPIWIFGDEALFAGFIG